MRAAWRAGGGTCRGSRRLVSARAALPWPPTAYDIAPHPPLPNACLSRPKALRTVRKDSFKKAAKDLQTAGSIVERLGGGDRVHDIIAAFYRKLFAHAVRPYFRSALPRASSRPLRRVS